MKSLKRKLAAILAISMIITNVIPAFAEPVSEMVKTENQQTEEVQTESELESEYKEATPSEAGYADAEEMEKEPEEIILEEATPSNAEYAAVFKTVVDGVRITVSADAGVFPEGAQLWAEKVEDEATEEAIEEAVEKERDNNVNVAYSIKFDIKMLVNGEEVQPDTEKGSVKVFFTLEEKISNCIDANAYHLKEDADGELTAENLEAEVKTVEEAAEEEKEAGDNSETVKAVNANEDRVMEDGILVDDVSNKVTKLEADTDGFSYYVVEFTYNELQYVLPGDTSIKLSAILRTLAIEGTVSEAVVSNEELFTVEKDTEGDDWTVTALEAFSSKEWMKVTIDGKEYTIVVTDSVSLPVKPDEVIDLLFDKVIKFPGSGIAEWGAKKLIDTLFPQPKGVSNEDLADMLTQVMEMQSQVLAGLKSLEGIVNATQYQQILNDFNLQNGHAQYYTKLVSPELKKLDDQYNKDRELTEEEEKKLSADRISLLTKTIGISESQIESAAEPIDLGTSDLYNMITVNYNIQVGNQQISTDLLGVYYELMRQKYDWEHLAYEEIAAFNDNVVSNYLSVATIDIASLEARATLCEEKGYTSSAGHLRSRVESVKKEILEVKKIYDKHTLTEQNVYRHFWKPDHELTIYTKAARREIPDENCGNASKNFSNAKGFDYENRSLKTSFWMPLFKAPVMDVNYVTGLSFPLIDTESVNHLLEGTNHQKTLQQILKEGGFEGIADADTLLLPYTDDMNKGLYLESHSGGTSGYTRYYWEPRLSGISLSQKASVGNGKAKTLDTYEYYKQERSIYGTDWEIHNQKSSAKLVVLQKYCEHDWEKYLFSFLGFQFCWKCGGIRSIKEPLGDDDPDDACLHPNLQVQDVTGIIGEEGFELKCDKCHLHVILNSKAQRLHYPILVEGKKPTSYADGWKDYYQCSECGACFEDGVGLKRINDLEAWKKGAGCLVHHGGSDIASKPVYTGTWNNPVSNGRWTLDANGVWHYTTNASFCNTWGYIVNPYATSGHNSADWFYFDAYGNMLTGWQLIGGKWYYLNPFQNGTGTLGACLIGPGKTPDGLTIDENGAWIGR